MILAATNRGDEPSRDADRPGPCDREGDGPGAGHVPGSCHLQPLVRLHYLSAQEKCSRPHPQKGGEWASVFVRVCGGTGIFVDVSISTGYTIHMSRSQ